MDTKKVAPKNRHELDFYNLQPSDWNSNKIQVDCDDFVSASDAYMKKKINLKKKRFGFPGKAGFKARTLGNKLVRKNINVNNKRRPNLVTRDWAKISIHPFINFLRFYRRRFARNAPNEEIARRGRCEWRKMTCKAKEKYYEQAKRAKIRGYRL